MATEASAVRRPASATATSMNTAIRAADSGRIERVQPEPPSLRDSVSAAPDGIVPAAVACSVSVAVPPIGIATGETNVNTVLAADTASTAGELTPPTVAVSASFEKMVAELSVTLTESSISGAPVVLVTVNCPAFAVAPAAMVAVDGDTVALAPGNAATSAAKSGVPQPLTRSKPGPAS